jgi:UDP-N-acetyl-D-glucosamine dehydrogenase
MKISIVGLGYVGLPLSLQFARSGATVLGLDIDQAKVDALNAGRSYIKHITGEAIQAERKSGRFEASTDFSRIKGRLRGDHLRADSAQQEPRTGHLLHHGDWQGGRPAPGQRGTVVVLESTTYPGHHR